MGKIKTQVAYKCRLCGTPGIATGECDEDDCLETYEHAFNIHSQALTCDLCSDWEKKTRLKLENLPKFFSEKLRQVDDTSEESIEAARASVLKGIQAFINIQFDYFGHVVSRTDLIASDVMKTPRHSEGILKRVILDIAKRSGVHEAQRRFYAARF